MPEGLVSKFTYCGTGCVQHCHQVENGVIIRLSVMVHFVYEPYEAS